MAAILEEPPRLIPPPPGPKRVRWWSWQRSSGKFFLISVGVHLLFGGVAAVLVVQQYQATRKLTFKGGPPSPNPSTRAIEHKVQMAKKQSTMSAPSIAKRITTTGLSKVALPDMPAMPKLAAQPTKMAGAGGTDVSFNPGGMMQSGGSGAGGAAVPFFGFREARGGGSLVGKFYDLKQLKDGKPSNLDQEHGYPGELSNFVKGGWNESALAKYFVGPNPLYTTQVFIPKLPAEQGVRAFNLGNVQPRMWIIVYRGTVIPPESGTYHFVGMADDVMVVRFENRVVLDCGSTNPSGRGPTQFYASDGLQLKKDMSWYKGLGRGDAFQVKGGESYPIEIMIGEWPGGDFKAWLMLEQEGAKYDKDSHGNPILPIFKLAASTVSKPAVESPVFAQNGPVWKAEKPKEQSPSPSPH